MGSLSSKHFDAIANKKISIIWLIICVVLSMSYLIEVFKGIRGIGYVIIFCTITWLPYIIGLVVLHFKGKETQLYRWICVIGYLCMYIFVLITSVSSLGFVYILPLASIMTLYKDKKLMIRLWVLSECALAIGIIIQIINGATSAQNITNYEIQIAAITICCLALTVGIGHVKAYDDFNEQKLQESLDKVIDTIDRVKKVSTSVVNGVDAIRSIADDNKESANRIIYSMGLISDSNNELIGKTNESLSMTRNISSQVNTLDDLVKDMTVIVNETVSDTDKSIVELREAIQSTNEMSDISHQISEILKKFKDEFEIVKTETSVIEQISSKTNLLALNASVESARAGEAGKSFKVVAAEIHDLSSGTKDSSKSIMTALGNLSKTSANMTESISKIISLIDNNIIKMNCIEESVDRIYAHSAELGNNVKSVDSAMRGISEANYHMDTTIQNVCDNMDRVNTSVKRAESDAEDMKRSYRETTNSIANVEKLVNTLMVDLGEGGLLGARDISVGMAVMVEKSDGTVYTSKVIRVTEDYIQVGILMNETDIIEYNKGDKLKFQVTVDNVLYNWDNIEISEGNAGTFKIKTFGSPVAVNRRKFVRMPLSNACSIYKNKVIKGIDGNLLDISAGGFAFKTPAIGIPYEQKDLVKIDVKSFEHIEPSSKLEGSVIRCLERDGYYIVGCRLLKDNDNILNYIKDNFGEQQNSILNTEIN